MILQNLLKDKRYEWQEATQNHILNSLLCKSHRYKVSGQQGEKLVTVFGKSHSGKTTFILTLMGVKEDKISELNHILRAGVPEGQSSTSTAIIYQKSDDDSFGICEHSISDVMNYAVEKCTQEYFVERIMKTRSEVEAKKRNRDCVLYLYIPDYYFEKERSISILDMPGYETTNLEEKEHTNALLSKYMNVAALNIIVRSIYDINDLRYFPVANGEDYTKLLSGKYIIVTTRTYSQESIYKYFNIERSKRTVAFEDFLLEECSAQFQQIFEGKVPKFYPIDIGESFNELIHKKIRNPEDRDYLIEFRERMLDRIYEYITSRQNDSLFSWVKELIEDEDYYSNVEKDRIDREIEKISDSQKCMQSQCEEQKLILEKLEQALQSVEQQKADMCSVIITFTEPKREELMKLINKKYGLKKEKGNKDLSAVFANVYKETIDEILDRWYEEYAEIFSDKIKEKWNNYINIKETKIMEKVDGFIEDNTKNIIFIIKSKPSDEMVIDYGREVLYQEIPLIINDYYKASKKEYEATISQKKEECKKLEIVITQNRQKLESISKLLSDSYIEKKKLEKQKENIDIRKKRDNKMLKEYRKIAREKYLEQRNNILSNINETQTKEEKIEYLILLGLIEKDYKKILME